MNRLLAFALLVLLAAVAALGVQSWRLSAARNKLDTQQTTIADQRKKLSQKNGQLIALNILTQTSSRAQTQLYAAAEQNSTLLRDRLRTIEELKRENDELRRWADAPLPDAVIRLRQRPALTGGESYREWLSQNHPVPPGTGRPAQ
ncbi:putative regulatory protein [Pantoea sp. AS-PWVM4]|uniref:Rz-like lysis system protein LysB n=1 Tax=Pantoea sp. AS-PWVM4 TaxID=1332069 RepID=UPI0003AC6B04|nr:Rz-like lysis system protein LysB [Pantoea sp. AS-PWVM4]ERK13273.1 putative regulatory protein [Pantoea sp. AS-PWVM4]